MVVLDCTLLLAFIIHYCLVASSLPVLARLYYCMVACLCACLCTFLHACLLSCLSLLEFLAIGQHPRDLEQLFLSGLQCQTQASHWRVGLGGRRRKVGLGGRKEGEGWCRGRKGRFHPLTHSLTFIHQGHVLSCCCVEVLR